MKKRIVITGATGLIGTHLCKELFDRGDTLTIFTSDTDKAKKKLPYADEYINWDYRKPEEWKSHLNSKDAIIHLAGANIGAKRWTKNYKKSIFESRVLSTRNIVKAIGRIKDKPEVFICASGSTYYGNGEEKIFTESSPPGEDFLSYVSLNWEKEAAKVEMYNVRRVSVRGGVFLSSEGGALKKLLLPFRLFIGGPLGTGKQWFSWIHPTDGVRAYLFLLDNGSVNGAINVTSPNPVRMKELAVTLGKILNRPSLLRVPEAVIRIFFGEMAGTVTQSSRVVPLKLQQNNFDFRFGNLRSALEDLLKN